MYSKTQRNTKELEEQINLQEVGILHGSCIDKKRIERLLGGKLIAEKDENQREECGCFKSVT
ncbi:MAG: DUF1848 family protein [Lachnospiraceae bacterium]|nr:DUF1848 family protein [Lachnospiraceae bacterium]MDE6184842.1 DUF1848 family protein [Lachnospiraceae bacterium]